MRRDPTLLQRRRQFVVDYVNTESQKGELMKNIVINLCGILFLSERTIYNDLCPPGSKPKLLPKEQRPKKSYYKPRPKRLK